jgi:integrase
MPVKDPTASIIIREQGEQAFYEAKFRHDGRQVKRRIGPAWLKDGRVPRGFYNKGRAEVAAEAIVAAYVADAANVEQVERERKERGVTFREIARDYLRWLEDVKGAKPSTLADHRYVLGEAGVRYRRRAGESAGHVMSALGDRSAAKISTQDVEKVLATISKTGVAPRTVNKQRAVISAVFNYGAKAFNLPANPAAGTDKRREPHRGALVYYSSEEVEALARGLSHGLHREAKQEGERASRTAVERAEDAQDAELIRVAAYAGLRLGELLALRWRNVDFTGHALTIERAMSAGVESSTKSGHIRRVPLPDQAAGALDRLSKRDDFTAPGELVFCNELGRTLDGSALRRRFKKARDAAKLRPLRFHDLRHTYGSLLAAAGVDLVTIQSAMGHSALATTGRYLHAKPATEQAAVFTRAFQPSSPGEPSESVLSPDG